MTCMLWDIETGSRSVEFSDHTGDVMRWVPRSLQGDVHSHVAPACHWAQTQTYLFRVHAMLPQSFGTFARAKPHRLSLVTSPTSMPSSMLFVRIQTR
jgi:hypothetical protein